ncbi:MAG: TIM barrel protein [Methanomicrobiales archaeon]|nr:TIM barrel protein [Methanomicrobiales archaeon]
MLPPPGRPYRIGAGARSDDPATFSALSRFARGTMIDHIQVLLIPGPEASVNRQIAALEDACVPVMIHAPHHGQGVNPSDPEMTGRSGPAGRAWMDAAMAETFEAADRTAAPVIVLHPGAFRSGEKEAAEIRIADFLDDYRDKRLILENLPAVYDECSFLGTDAAELSRIGRGRIRGYCLDFAHLYCAAQTRNRSFYHELAAFGALSIRFCHLSNVRRGSGRDEHLALDHPAGGLDFAAVMAFLRRRPRIHTSLEYKENDPAVYRRQLAVFDALYWQHRSPEPENLPRYPRRCRRPLRMA